MRTRIHISGDTHDGHLCGIIPKKLIPPNHPLNSLMHDFADFYETERMNGYDVALHLGDIVDGPGYKDASHLWLPGIDDQKEVSCNRIKKIKADKHYFVYGTGYHTGNSEDYEKDIANVIGGNISWQQKISIQGIKFDLSHTIGKSGTPTGGDISLKKEILWTLLHDYLNDVKGTADYIIRGHAHEYRRLETDWNCGIMNYAMKIGSPDHDRYARRVRGWYSVGFIDMIIDKGKVIEFNRHHFKYKIKKGYEEIIK